MRLEKVVHADGFDGARLGVIIGHVTQALQADHLGAQFEGADQ